MPGIIPDGRSAGQRAPCDDVGGRLGCLPAGLADALPVVMRVLADRAALDTDVAQLAQALPALVRSVRYGDVRGTDTASLTEVALGLAERVLVGAVAVGPEAGEWLGQLTLAVRARVSIDVLLDTIQPYPTFSESIFNAVRELASQLAA